MVLCRVNKAPSASGVTSLIASFKAKRLVRWMRDALRHSVTKMYLSFISLISHNFGDCQVPKCFSKWARAMSSTALRPSSLFNAALI